jgi:hypothetical protein
MTSWGCKSSIFAGSRMRCPRTSRTNPSLIRVSFSRPERSTKSYCRTSDN